MDETKVTPKGVSIFIPRGKLQSKDASREEFRAERARRHLELEGVRTPAHSDSAARLGASGSAAAAGPGSRQIQFRAV